MGDGSKTLLKSENFQFRQYSYGVIGDLAVIGYLASEVDEKPRLESEKTLISNLYLCLEEKGQDEKRKPHLDLTTTRYPRVLDAMEGEFKKKKNETYEVFQLMSRKQHIGESLEQFHSILSGLAARCSFGRPEYSEVFSL